MLTQTWSTWRTGTCERTAEGAPSNSHCTEQQSHSSSTGVAV
jgi:hypothetical protein